MADLLLAPVPLNHEAEKALVFHVENPIRQSWEDILDVIATHLSIPSTNRVPYKDWVEKVMAHSDSEIEENPAKKMATFFQGDFEHMSGGQVIMGTDHSRACSDTLRVSRPVGDDLVTAYVKGWRNMRFLM